MNRQEKLEKVIKGLKYLHDVQHWSPTESNQDIMARRSITEDAITFLKIYEPSAVESKRIDLADETKDWLGEMNAVEALRNIADICVDWDGYRTADGLGGLINEVWAYARYCADNLAKAQEAVEPVFERQFMSDIEIYDCGKCGASLGAKGIAKYCMKCGQAVKWE